MARRRRNQEPDFAQGIVQLLAALMLAALFLPSVRNILLGFGILAGGAVVLAVVVTLGVILFRRSRNKVSCDIAVPIPFEVTVSPPPTIQMESVRPVEDTARPVTIPGLIEQLRSIDWFQFEKLVGLSYRKLGYSVTRRGGANPDGGIDLIIVKDGLETAVQCKQWKTWNVGVKAVREFLGALTDARVQRGIFITLCGYSGEARQLAEKHGIEIVNEVGLARMLEDTGARFDPETLEILRDTRKFCPKCENEMVLRTATKGSGAGKQFWGCAAYPKCRFTMPYAEVLKWGRF